MMTMENWATLFTAAFNGRVADVEAFQGEIDPQWKVLYEDMLSLAKTDRLDVIQLFFVYDHALNQDIVQALAQGLINNPQQRFTVDLARRPVGNEGAQALATAIELNDNIVNLSLKSALISDEGAVALANAIGKSQVIGGLDLTNNQITSEASEALARSFTQCPSLNIVSLSDNQLDDKCAPFFAKAIKQSTALSYLHLTKNALTQRGIDILQAAVNRRPDIVMVTVTSTTNSRHDLTKTFRHLPAEEKVCRVKGIFRNNFFQQQIYTLLLIRDCEPTSILGALPMELMFELFSQVTDDPDVANDFQKQKQNFFHTHGVPFNLLKHMQGTGDLSINGDNIDIFTIFKAELLEEIKEYKSLAKFNKMITDNYSNDTFATEKVYIRKQQILAADLYQSIINANNLSYIVHHLRGLFTSEGNWVTPFGPTLKFKVLTTINKYAEPAHRLANTDTTTDEEAERCFTSGIRQIEIIYNESQNEATVTNTRASV